MKIETGMQFPSFSFMREDGTSHTTEEELSLHAKTIFYVLRYIGCPVCRLDVHTINERYEEFVRKDAQVCVVLQSDPAHVQKEMERSNETLKVPVICDSECVIYDLLEIKEADNMLKLVGGNLLKMVSKGKEAGKKGYSHGDYEGREKQLPAVFIVNKEGITEYVHYAKNMTDLPSVDELLEKV